MPQPLGQNYRGQMSPASEAEGSSTAVHRRLLARQYPARHPIVRRLRTRKSDPAACRTDAVLGVGCRSRYPDIPESNRPVDEKVVVVGMRRAGNFPGHIVVRIGPANPHFTVARIEFAGYFENLLADVLADADGERAPKLESLIDRIEGCTESK
jgi:hypothetical protein